jgi:hypothetical protein
MLQFNAATCPGDGVSPLGLLQGVVQDSMKNPGAATFMTNVPLPSTWEVDALTTSNWAVPDVGASNGTTKLIWPGATNVKGE